MALRQKVTRLDPTSVYLHGIKASTYKIKYH